jgi:hypothetical protein
MSCSASRDELSEVEDQHQAQDRNSEGYESKNDPDIAKDLEH